jgi:hypothetical protein
MSGLKINFTKIEIFTTGKLSYGTYKISYLFINWDTDEVVRDEVGR